MKGNRRNSKIQERTRRCDGNIGVSQAKVSRHIFPEEAARISARRRDLNRIHWRRASEWQHKRAANLPNLLHQRGTTRTPFEFWTSKELVEKKRKEKKERKKGEETKEKKRLFSSRRKTTCDSPLGPQVFTRGEDCS